MIAIAAISEKLATIAARLTAAWPGAARSCPSARRSGGLAGKGRIEKTHCASRGTSKTAPSSRQAIEA
ncbi:hypothetical protein D3C83_84530 [compost metagenome]